MFVVFDHLGDNLVDVARDGVVGDLVDRGFGVRVDRDDHRRLVHAGRVLDLARNAAGDVELRTHRDARLAHLARMLREARVDSGAGWGPPPPPPGPPAYPIGEIDRIVMVGLDGDTVNYVREIRYRMFKSNSPDTKKEKGRYRMPVLFREDYRGKDGIALLTEFRETEQTTGLRTALQKERWCYVKLKDEPAARVLSVSTAGENPESTQKNFVRFAKQTFANYPDLVQRIESNEFSVKDPLKLVKAYEAIVTY